MSLDKLAVVSCFLFLNACCKSETVQCYKDQLSPVAVNYTIDELSSVKVIWYNATTGYTERIDSAVYNYFAAKYSPTTSDTIPLGALGIYDPPKNGKPYTEEYNVELYILSSNKSYRFGNITTIGKYTEQATKCERSYGCTNYISSYQLDGEIHNLVESSTRAVYLVK